MKTRRRIAPKICGACNVRPAWEANRLPVCEPCFAPVPQAEKFNFWRELERALVAVDVQAAIRAARARLLYVIRTTRG